MAHSQDTLLIIDFGSQVTQLIARRLRELAVYCEIIPFQAVTSDSLAALKPKAVILSGGPSSVLDAQSPRAPDAVFTLGVPVLGICYGQQVMMTQLGGRVESGAGTAEFGRAYVTPSKQTTPLLAGWFEPNDEQVWMSHGDHVAALAPGFEVLGGAISPRGSSHAQRREAFGEFCDHGRVHRHLDNGRV